MKTIQHFTPEYLERCSKMTATEKLRFLDNYRKLYAASNNKPQSKSISLRIDENLLDVFKTQCELNGIKYQTQIKELMKAYLNSSDNL